jgi:hypothetical protein
MCDMVLSTTNNWAIYYSWAFNSSLLSAFCAGSVVLFKDVREQAVLNM